MRALLILDSVKMDAEIAEMTLDIEKHLKTIYPEQRDRK
jgi:hypothetical protein